MKTRNGKIVPTIKLDDFGKKILHELEKGEMSDKEIANKFKVELDVVKAIKKRHCKVDRTKIAESETQPALLIPKTPISDIYEETKEKPTMPSVKRSSSDRSKRTKISDDLKIEFITTFEEHPNMSINKLKNMFGISVGSAYKILEEFGYDRSKRRQKIKEDEMQKNELVAKETVKEEVKAEEAQLPAVETSEKTEEKSIDLPDIISNFVKATKKSSTLEVNVYDEMMKNNHIFNPYDYVLNFYDLVKRACDWIDENVAVASNQFIQKLILHTSENELMNFAVIKACENKKVNLDLVVENKRTNHSETVTMFHKFEMGRIDKSNIDFQLAQKGEIYLYGMKSSMEVNVNYYEIDLIEFDSRGKERKRLFIFNEKEDSWKYFSSIVDFINATPERSFKATLNEVQVHPETAKTSIKPIIKSL